MRKAGSNIKKIKFLTEDLLQKKESSNEFKLEGDQALYTENKYNIINRSEDQQNKLITMINNTDDIKIKKMASNALRELNKSPLDQRASRIITKNISEIRKANKGNSQDIALELGKLAYNINSSNPYFLGELCVLRNHIGDYETVINDISEFMERMKRNSIPLPKRNKEYLVVNLAYAYDGIGNQNKGIELLIELNSGANNVLEAMAELYYNAEQAKETVTLLQNRELTPKMAKWLVKSYIDLSLWENAMEVAERFNLESLRGEAQERLQIPLQDKSKKVWVIHGRNEKLTKSMFQFLRAIGLVPIEWSEAKSKTGKNNAFIIDIVKAGFEYAEAFVVLLTGDDEAKCNNEYIKHDDLEFERNLWPQPRPNVLFEAGMAFGRNPGKVVFVRYGKIRPFTDLSGMHILSLDNSVDSRMELAGELKNAGCELEDLTNKRDWLSAGNFDLDEKR